MTLATTTYTHLVDVVLLLYAVNFDFTGKETGELSVNVDEIIGIINEDTEDDMWLVSVLTKLVVLTLLH